MQKKLIAAAVAGLIAVPALAQTNVTISGRFAAGYQNYKLSGGGSTGLDTYNGVSDQSSRIIFNVNEDLGGGLSAWGQADMRFSQDLGGIGMTGNTGMGLMSKSWGKFTIGRWDVHYQEIAGGTNAGMRASALENVTSFGLMSQVNGVTIANGTRAWGSYQFGMGLSVGLAFDRSSVDLGAVTSRRTAWYIPINYAFGPHKVYFDYSKANDASNTVGNSAGKQWSVGYDYAFSKRTSAGVYYTKVSNNTAGSYDMFAVGRNSASLATLPGEDARMWYFGMAHNF